MEFTGNIFGYASSVVRKLDCAFCTSLTCEQWLDYACSFIDSNLSWRVPLFFQVVIGAILAAGSLVMPESPRYVISTCILINVNIDAFTDGSSM